MKSLHASNLTLNEEQQWIIVNDGVMGGLSTSDIVNLEGGISRFQGSLSLENNGGFASIRAIVKKGRYKGARAICIEVNGDGREYQFRLRDTAQFDGYAYVTRFKTKLRHWQKICFSPTDFIPEFRGRVLKHIPTISFKNVIQIGFLIADNEESNFQLDVRSISEEY